MNYLQANEYIYTKTEKEASVLLRNLIESYDSARKDIIAQLESVYGKYLTTTDPQDYYNIMIQYDRLNKLLTDVTQTFNYYSKLAGDITAQAMTLSMQNVYYRQNYLLEWITPVAGITFNFAPLDKRLVELSVFGTQDAWKAIQSMVDKKVVSSAIKAQMIKGYKAYQPDYGTLSQLLYDRKVQDLILIQREISQAFIQGKSINQISNDLINLFDKVKYKADRVARTETHRTANLGAYAAGQEARSQGVDIKKMWIATLDTKTRPQHAHLDGVKLNLDEYYKIGADRALMPGGFNQASLNINCRCTHVDIVNDIDPQIRRGRNPITGENEVFEFKTYDQWAKDNGLKQNKQGTYYLPETTK